MGWHNWSCLIAEQAAQLGLEALLHGAGHGDTSGGHDPVRLLEAAAALTGLTLTATIRDAGVRLARRYQPSRYPDALLGGPPRPRYTASDATEAIEDAAAVLAAVAGAVRALRAAADEGGGDGQPS